MAHYLVSGVAGFIASAVTALLLREGHTVVGVDNLDNAYDVRLKQWRLERLKNHERMSFERCDVSDRAAVEDVWARSGPFDAVIHLAARAGVRYSVENPWVYLETNAAGTLNLLDAGRRRGLRKFVLASTSSLYGAHNALPYSESADTSRPLSPYAASKQAAEALCHAYHHLYGLDVSILRYFTVYGPAGRPDMSIFRFIQWIAEGRPVTVYGDGTQSHDFTYVEDVARGTAAACKPLGYEVINLGSDRPVSIADTIALIENLVGKRADIQYEPAHRADVPATWADIAKARRMLDWAPTTKQEEGLERCVKWYLENRSWAAGVKTR